MAPSLVASTPTERYPSAPPAASRVDDRAALRCARWWLLATILACGAGCAVLAPPPAPANVPFDIVGRVAVNFDGRAFSSNIRWRHEGVRGEVWLMTPLGQTLAHIQTDDEGATLTTASRDQYRAGSVEALTRQSLGWELPLARLTWWILGEPAPAEAPVEASRDGRARLTRLEQDGWLIEYLNYPPDEHGGRPRRVDLRNASQHIRILIDTWRAAEPAP